MKKWSIKLLGHELDLDYLYDNQTHPAYSIVKDEEDYYIESPDFNNIEDYNQVKDLGTVIIQKINGVATVVKSKYEPIKLEVVCETDENGNIIKRYIETGKSVLILGITSSGTLSSGEDVNEEYDPIQIIFSLMENNEYFLDALIIFGKGKSWFDLYKIGEIIKKSKRRTEILDACNINLNEFENFMKNCNYYRHYQQKADKPKFKIISRSKACGLIRNMLKKWAELLS